MNVSAERQIRFGPGVIFFCFVVCLRRSVILVVVAYTYVTQCLGGVGGGVLRLKKLFGRLA